VGRNTGYESWWTVLTDLLIPIYDRGFELLGGRRYDAFRRRTVNLLAPRPGERLLDAGCGTGYVTLQVAARYLGTQIHGVDLSLRMIAHAQSTAARHGLPATFHVGSILTLPYPDACFDVVTTNIMFHQLERAEQKARAAQEVARVLRPGGRYVSAEFDTATVEARARPHRRGPYPLPDDVLNDAGFTVLNDEHERAMWRLHVRYRVAEKRG
jgi:ubiquinone/menaquinone biosynthesis C-methylase UbiE